ncbi:Sodium/calcium exchanger domain containing protein [Rhypophila decipiens]
MHRVRSSAKTNAHGTTSSKSAPSRTNSRATVQPASSTPVTLPVQNSQDRQADNQETRAEEVKKRIIVRFMMAVKGILFYSVINVFLVFVPVGMVVHFTSMPAGVVFAMNAIAIVPLAGLLSHATESVASRMGDTVGALINVTFGNAVELIIFIIALVKDEIRIVQASLVGSILANLLLILGMSFFLGGLRFREQIYNSTVTQMSSCLLSLSVTSLLLPTAFHASFHNLETANFKVLEVSRGTSVVLLLVYLLYLVFQLRSHSYMYESTPQEVIERESVPGPAAQYFHPSPPSSSRSSSSQSDTDGSLPSDSRRRRRMKRMMKRGKKSRKSSPGSSKIPGPSRTHGGSRAATPDLQDPKPPRRITLVDSPITMTPITTPGTVCAEDPMEKFGTSEGRKKQSTRSEHQRPNQMHGGLIGEKAVVEKALPSVTSAGAVFSPRRVDFALGSNIEAQQPLGRPRPFSLRSLRPPTNAFTASPINPFAVASAAACGVVDSSSEPKTNLKRSRTLPAGRRPPATTTTRTATGAITPHKDSRKRSRTLPTTTPNDSIAFQANCQVPGSTDPPHDNDNTTAEGDDDENEKQHQTSITTAIILLLISTGLVAVCAEFMVDSIDAIVTTNQSSSSGGGISEAFIGLILLPIVGNAAEHVTAVSVALKNKMDLAIGVALGSSIQIALFITPLVVLIGWILGKDMSLFFTLFETICMFVSAFIVNFLVLDGRSNYLEGALLCSAYVIISVAAFFSPNPRAASELGGGGSGDGGV